jgi:DNA-directed RNA polymerase specialized sigma24 family protein
MSSDESVTQWLVRLKNERDEDASQRLYQRYIERLLVVARNKLGPSRRRDADEEDIVLSVINTLFQGIANGVFPQLADRGDLWQVLLMLVERRSADQRRRQLADKRGGGAVGGESVLICGGIDGVPGSDPTPELAVELREELERRLGQLSDPELRQIAIWKMEAHTNEEIARKLGCVLRTVERRLGLIRRIWKSP